MFWWAHSTDDFIIGDHVAVLSDYKETVPENFFNFLQSHCSHVTDMLIKYRQNCIPLVLLKCNQMRRPSMLTTIPCLSASARSRQQKIAKCHYANYTLPNMRHDAADTSLQ